VRSPTDTSQRLADLERILAQPVALTPAGDDKADPAQLHLSSVPAERIRRLTAQLASLAPDARDDVALVAMRMLLNDYAAAVAHLRAALQVVAPRIESAAVPIHEGLDMVRRERKLLTRQRPSDTTAPETGAS
jgi:hypothetical protein